MRRFNVNWTSLGVLALLFALIWNQTSVSSALSLAMAPVLQVLQAPVRWADRASRWLDTREHLQDELARARELLQRQALLTQQVHALKAENRQLKSLLHVAHITGYTWQAARVLGRSPDTKSRRLILQVRHAQADDVVVSRDGLVGLVAEADGRHAVARTILDASVAVPVTIAGSHLAALVRGLGDSLEVDFVPWNEAPKPGDILVTSGAGGLYPPGLAVVRITQVTRVEGSMFARIAAEPVAHWRSEQWLAIASHAERHTE